MYRRLKLKLIATAVGLALVAVGVASAQATSPGSITVSPAQLNILDGDTKVGPGVPITITNSYDVAVNLSAQFQGIDENAGLLIPADNLDPAFASALHVSQTDIAVPAHGSTIVNLRVTGPATLAPGGHYATLVLTQLGGGRHLSLNAALSLDIFVIKPVGARQSLTLNGFKTNGNLFRLPSIVTLSFEDTGNIHVIPRAAVDLTAGQAGQDNLVAHGVANTGSLPLLPGYTLASPTPLTRLGHVWFPRKLRLTVTYRADGGEATRSSSRSLWYVPPAYPLLALLLVLAAYRLAHHRWRIRAPRAVMTFTEPVVLTPAAATGPKARVIKVVDGDQPAAAKKTKRLPKAGTPVTKKAAAKGKKAQKS